MYFAKELPRTIQIDLGESSGILAVQWMNATTGNSVSSESVSGGNICTFTAPTDDDWILHVIPVEGLEEEPIVSQPSVAELLQNYPNPFNPTTEIKYTLLRDSHVKVEVYNLLGQRVASLVDERQMAGYKTVIWDARSFASGVYFYRLQAGDFVETKRMILLK